MVLGVIPARGGSKGVIRKNIRLVAGKPLIAYSIECGLSCRIIDHLIVSTDSKEIAEIAKRYGADVPFIRPSELAGDKVPMLQVLQHALINAERYYDGSISYLVLLDPTGPLRTINDIEECLLLLREGPYDAVVSGNKAHRNPYFNMVKVEGSYVSLVKEIEGDIGRRQDAPEVYDLNTIVWAYSRRSLMEDNARLPRRTGLYLVPNERAIDLDTEFDFQLLEFLLSKYSFNKIH